MYIQRLSELLSTMVRMPSRSSADGGEEGELQRFVATKMRELGARVSVFEAKDVPEFFTHPLCHNPKRNYEGRPTVIGEIGPVDAPALMLIAHSDTVQVHYPEQWSIDPFSGEIKDEAIWGLGASDDKWGLAVMLVLMEELQSTGHLSKRLVFASTIDEESGVGNGTLLLMLHGIRADAALYLDGYAMQALIGNLGGSFLYVRPKGSIDQGLFLSHSDSLEAVCRSMSEHRAHLYDQPYFCDNITRYSSVLYCRGCPDTENSHVIAFYMLPGEDRDDFARDIEMQVSQALGDDIGAYETSYCEPWFEPGFAPQNHWLTSILAESIQEELHAEPEICSMCKIDSFVINNHARIPTIMFGCTRHISGKGAFHQPDERLQLEDLRNGYKIVRSVVNKYLAQ